MNKEYIDLLCEGNLDLESAIKILRKSQAKIIIVVDDRKRLLGTLTDGDVRRGLLSGLNMQDSIDRFANLNPIFVTDKEILEKKNIFQDLDILHIPVINEEKKVVDILSSDLDEEGFVKHAVIMAGGFGKRLGDISKTIPKPMNKFEDKPLLEWIILDLITSGINKFYISVFYKKEIIKEYFKDGSQFGCEIVYLEEKEPIGTAGCLSLISDRNNPLLILNADLVTALDYKSLFNFHKKNNNSLTVSIRKHIVNIPFGVFDLEHETIKNLEEKPSRDYFINAGIYILEPELLDLVSPNTHMDMTELIEKLIADRIDISAFFLHERWIDVGIPEDLEFARTEFKKIK